MVADWVENISSGLGSLANFEILQDNYNKTQITLECRYCFDILRYSHNSPKEKLMRGNYQGK